MSCVKIILKARRNDTSERFNLIRDEGVIEYSDGYEHGEIRTLVQVIREIHGGEGC